MSIVQQAIDITRAHVINQVRYQVNIGSVYDERYDAMRMAAEEISDYRTVELLQGAEFLNDDNMLALANEIGLVGLTDEDDWVDPVADYIYNNTNQCTPVIEALAAIVDQQEEAAKVDEIRTETNEDELDHFMSVFNGHKNDAHERAMAVLAIDHPDTHEVITRLHESGIMAIFDKKPNKHSVRYAELVKQFVNER